MDNMAKAVENGDLSTLEQLYQSGADVVNGSYLPQVRIILRCTITV